MKRLLLMLAVLAAACASPGSRRDFSKLVAADPRALLVVPAVNKSMDLEAADFFLSTLPVPLAERGYYVFPVNLVKRLLEDEGMADAAMVHAADTGRLCRMFGADAVLYPTVEQWNAKFMVIATKVEVAFSYELKDCATGDVLWAGREEDEYQSSSAEHGLLGSVLAAAAEKARPDYLPMARQASTRALSYPGPGLPAGPYRPDYGKDIERQSHEAGTSRPR